jgi:acetylornithine deacetylase/succinyl-diaminopimelate desuccinylase-like protein
VRDCDEWIAKERDRLVDEWRDACRIPSVSANSGSELGEMADWLRDRAVFLFDELEVVEPSEAPPVLIGVVEGASERKLLLYSHYDVVEPGERSEWLSDPFGADIFEGRVVARGAGDDKSDLTARLQALRYWKDVRGRPPCTIVWLAEGAEEIGSPGLGPVLESNRELLKADGCLWESYYHSIDGRPAIGFGSCGVLDVELSLELLSADQHGGLESVYRSPIRELVHAVASLSARDGKIVVPGFYDDVRPLSDADLQALADSPPPPTDAALYAGRSSAYDDAHELTRRWLTEPTLSVSGVTNPGGTVSEGLVGAARSTVRFRLMPDQGPVTILRLLRDHLDAEGHGDVAIRVLSSIPPARSRMDTPLAGAVISAIEDVRGTTAPILHPIVPGAGPLHLFAEILAIDAVMPPGTIRTDGGMHAPNEHAYITDYLEVVRLNISTLDHFGRESR